MRAVSFLISVAILAAPAHAQARQPDYASAEDLTQAVRCSTAKFIVDALARNMDLRKVKGTVTITRVAEFSNTTGGGVGADFLPVAATGSVSGTRMKTVALGGPVNFNTPRAITYTEACKRLRIDTRDRRGRAGPPLPGLLFTIDDVFNKGPPTNPAFNTALVSGKFGRLRSATAGGKFTFFGLLKANHGSSVSDTRENGYSVTFCFGLPARNAAGLPYTKGDRAGMCG